MPAGPKLPRQHAVANRENTSAERLASPDYPGQQAAASLPNSAAEPAAPQSALPPDASTRITTRIARWEPHWLIRDVLVALLIGMVLVGAQTYLDGKREARVRSAENQRAQLVDRLENLKAIRERSDRNAKDDLLAAQLNLSGKDLHEMDLSNLNLSGANLYDANLRGADLTETNLKGAQLQQADLRGATLIATQFDGADLSNADLREATLTLTRFRDAWLGAVRFGPVDLSTADLRAAKLGGTDLDHVNFVGVQGNGPCFNVTTLWPAHFQGVEEKPYCRERGSKPFISDAGRNLLHRLRAE